LALGAYTESYASSFSSVHVNSVDPVTPVFCEAQAEFNDVSVKKKKKLNVQRNFRGTGG